LLQSLEARGDYGAGLVTADRLDRQLRAEVARIRDMNIAKSEGSGRTPSLPREPRWQIDDQSYDDALWDTAVPQTPSIGEEPFPAAESDKGGIPLGLCGYLHDWASFEKLGPLDNHETPDSAAH
jgi:hypothetical protein